MHGQQVTVFFGTAGCLVERQAGLRTVDWWLPTTGLNCFRRPSIDGNRRWLSMPGRCGERYSISGRPLLLTVPVAHSKSRSEKILGWCNRVEGGGEKLVFSALIAVSTSTFTTPLPTRPRIVCGDSGLDGVDDPGYTAVLP